MRGRSCRPATSGELARHSINVDAAPFRQFRPPSRKTSNQQTVSVAGTARPEQPQESVIQYRLLPAYIDYVEAFTRMRGASCFIFLTEPITTGASPTRPSSAINSDDLAGETLNNSPPQVCGSNSNSYRDFKPSQSCLRLRSCAHLL